MSALPVLPALVREPRWVIEGAHDYLTERIWDEARPPLVVVGMNPGKAQPTTGTYVGQYIDRITRIAVKHDYGGVVLLNIWTIADSDSDRALAHPDKVGPRADEILHEVLAAHPGVPILGAWGDRIAKVDDLTGNRLRLFIELAGQYNRPITCVGVNGGGGQPRHLSSFRPFNLDAIALLPWQANHQPTA